MAAAGPASAATTIVAPELRQGSVLFVDSHRVERFGNAKRVYFQGQKTMYAGIPGRVSIAPVKKYQGIELADCESKPEISLSGNQRQQCIDEQMEIDRADGDPDRDSIRVLGAGAVIADLTPDGRPFFRMYVRSGVNVGYRESTDGIQWHTVGNDHVIIIPKLQPLSVHRDPGSGDYVILGWKRGQMDASGKEIVPPHFEIWRSPAGNGRTFTKVSYTGGFASQRGDVIHASADQATGWTYAITKTSVADYDRRYCGARHGDQPLYSGGRAFASYASSGYRGWSSQANVFAADCIDQRSFPAPQGSDEVPATANPVQMYGLAFTRYGDQWLGFPWLFRQTKLAETRELQTAGHSDGPVDSQLASTPNVRTTAWRRSDPVVTVDGRKRRPVLIARGAAGTWDDGMVYANGSVLNFKGRSHVYYTGWDSTHLPTRDRTARPGMAWWRRDGFVGLRSRTTEAAVVTTKPFAIGADGGARNLTVNADLRDTGWMRVGVIDATTGRYLHEWEPRDSTLVKGDNLDKVVRWGTKNLGQLKGRKIKLVFTFKGPKATFYSYRVSSAIASGPATGTLSASTPTISGSPGTGYTLTAKPGTWGPSPVSMTYQWFRSGTPITGATGASYPLVSADRTHRISVRVTGRRSGYAATSRMSVPTGVVGTGFTAAPTPTIAGQTKVGVTLTARVGAWSPVPESLTYQWFRSGDAITGATGKTYTLNRYDRARRITVKVVARRAGYVTTTRLSAPTAGVLGVFSTAPTPTISGRRRVGEKLTANPGAWSPTPSSFRYQWYRSTTAISGANNRRYLLVRADRDARIRVRVTAVKDGYVRTPRYSSYTTIN